MYVSFRQPRKGSHFKVTHKLADDRMHNIWIDAEDATLHLSLTAEQCEALFNSVSPYETLAQAGYSIADGEVIPHPAETADAEHFAEQTIDEGVPW